MPTVALFDLGSSSSRGMLLDMDTKQLIWQDKANSCSTAADAVAVFDRFQNALSKFEAPSAVACSSFVGNHIQHSGTAATIGILTTYSTQGSDVLPPDIVEQLATVSGALPCAAYLTGNFFALRSDTTKLDCLGAWQLQHTFHVPRHISISEAAWLGVLPWSAPMAASFAEDCQFAGFDLPTQLIQALGLLPAVQTHPMQGSLGAHTVSSVFPCIGDGAAASLGSAALLLASQHVTRTAHQAAQPQPRPTMCISIGTSAAVRCILPLNERTEACVQEHLDTVVLQSGGWVYRVAPDAVLLGAAMTDGAAVLQDLHNTLTDAFTYVLPQGGSSAEACAEEALHACMQELAAQPAVLPGHSTVLPMLGGERAPGMRGGAASGIATHLRRGDGLRSAVLARVQGVCCQLADLVQAILPAIGVTSVQECHIVGSGAALEMGSLWRRVLSNALGAPVWTACSQRGQASNAGKAEDTGAAAPGSKSAPPQPSTLQLETTSIGLLVHCLWHLRQPALEGPSQDSGSSSSSSFAAAADACSAHPGDLGRTFAQWTGAVLPCLPQLCSTVPDDGEANRQAWSTARQRYADVYASAERSGLLPSRVSKQP